MWALLWWRVSASWLHSDDDPVVAAWAVDIAAGAGTSPPGYSSWWVY